MLLISFLVYMKVGCLLYCQVTKEVFQAAKGRLKVVGRAGVGVDNVDLASATDMLPACHGGMPLPSLLSHGMSSRQSGVHAMQTGAQCLASSDV